MELIRCLLLSFN